MVESRTVITISRQYGSGGREIGAKVAQALGVPCYDKELIDRAVKESGIAEEFFEQSSEKIKNPVSFLFSFNAGGNNSEECLPVSDRVFLTQSKIIKDAAAEGGCVIIGHCADYVLEEHTDVINIFIHGNLDTRIKRVAARNNLDATQAAARVKRTDKERATHYQHYTDRKWGRVENYDLSISSSTLGVEGTAAVILDYIKRREEVLEG